MARFIVCAEYKVPRWTTYEVEAESVEAAQQAVQDKINDNSIDWERAEWDFDSSTTEEVWVSNDGDMRVHWPRPEDQGGGRMTAHLYYPEMGGEPDRARLFQRASHVGCFTFVDWAPERDAEARAVFKRLKVRPTTISECELIKGGRKFTAQLTGAAWAKVLAEGDVSIEALL